MKNPDYIIGIDPYCDDETKAALVLMKRTSQGLKIVKIERWWSKYQWIQRLKWQFRIWRMKRFYKNVTVMKETNELNKATEYFKIKTKK